MDKKPIIGVVPLYDSKRESLWMIPGYMNGIVNGGGLPIMLPLTDDVYQLEQLLNTVDGILLTGGQDVSPELYGETLIEQCGETLLIRDSMELYLIPKAIEKNMPILGICRGIQILNTVLGGTLYQDIPLQTNSSIDHHMTPPYDRVVHEVAVTPESPLSELLRTNTIGVNSYHHQGIKTLSDKLRAMAKSNDGLIEAVYMPEKSFVWGLQWHPELSWESDVNSRKILAEFVNKSDLYKNLKSN